MRVVRVGIAVAVAAGVLAGPWAQAAPARPVCDLVTDSAGDVMPSAPGVDSNDYDIRSADIATDAHQLTAVIRLTSIAPENPSSVVYDTNEPGARTGTDLGEISGVVDSAHHEIRMTAPLSLFAPYASFKQTYVDQLYVTSARAVGMGDTSSPGGKVAIGSQSTALRRRQRVVECSIQAAATKLRPRRQVGPHARSARGFLLSGECSST
jgi:phytoene dehydrogenase-like protein